MELLILTILLLALAVCSFIGGRNWEIENKKNSKRAKYTVFQIIHHYTQGDTFFLTTITRSIDAKNKEEAIGIFIENTKEIKAEKKLNVDVIDNDTGMLV